MGNWVLLRKNIAIWPQIHIVNCLQVFPVVILILLILILIFARAIISWKKQQIFLLWFIRFWFFTQSNFQIFNLPILVGCCVYTCPSPKTLFFPLFPPRLGNISPLLTALVYWTITCWFSLILPTLKNIPFPKISSNYSLWVWHLAP